jgi:OTU-like cysteine protease
MHHRLINVVALCPCMHARCKGATDVAFGSTRGRTARTAPMQVLYGYGDLKEYCKQLARPTFWGGEVEMMVIAKMLEVPIYVYQPMSEIPGECAPRYSCAARARDVGPGCGDIPHSVLRVQHVLAARCAGMTACMTPRAHAHAACCLASRACGPIVHWDAWAGQQ